MDGKTLYAREISCPVCGRKSSTMRVRLSAIKIEKKDTDFCTYYRDVNPMLYEVYVCPHCGYAAHADHFENIDADGKKAVLQNVSRHWVSRDYGGERTLEQALECYKLALLCAQLKKDKPSALAGLCMRIAWLYRFIGDESEERRFMQAALENYTAAYERQFDDGGMSEINLLYIIGELYRRLGDPAKAVQWFSRVVGHEDRNKNALVVSMAREQWQSIRDHQK